MNEKFFTMNCPCNGKNLDRMLQPAILQAVSNSPMHGLAIIDFITYGPMFDGIQPDPTGVYRYLKKMEQAGLLTSQWEDSSREGRARRIYTITVGMGSGNCKAQFT